MGFNEKKLNIDINFNDTSRAESKIDLITTNLESCLEFTNTSFIDGKLRSYYDGLGDNTQESITEIGSSIKALGSILNQYVSEYMSIDDENYANLKTLINSLFDNYSELTGDLNASEDYDATVDTDYEVLEGEELEKFIKENNIKKDLETLEIRKVKNLVNGVEFYSYYVIDLATFNEESFDDYVAHSLEALAKVDKEVLEYVRDGGTSLVYFSDYTVDAGRYNEDGSYKGSGGYSGYCNSKNRNIICVYNNRGNYDTVLHEFGHALDFTLYYNLTGKTGKGISENAELLKLIEGKSLYQLATEDLSKLFDPAFRAAFEANYDTWNDGDKVTIKGVEYTVRVVTYGDYKTIELEDANGQRANYYYNDSGMHFDDFSLYSDKELVTDGGALEFFAESFKTYYSSQDSHSRYSLLIPNTYSFLDCLIGNIKKDPSFGKTSDAPSGGGGSHGFASTEFNGYPEDQIKHEENAAKLQEFLDNLDESYYDAEYYKHCQNDTLELNDKQYNINDLYITYGYEKGQKVVYVIDHNNPTVNILDDGTVSSDFEREMIMDIKYSDVFYKYYQDNDANFIDTMNEFDGGINNRTKETCMFNVILK